MISKGDIVKVEIGPGEAADSVRKYEGELRRISEVKTLSKARERYFELVGAESEHGIPFAFVEDWLVKSDS